MDEKTIGLILLSISLIISEILPFISASHKGIVQATLVGTREAYNVLLKNDNDEALPK